MSLANNNGICSCSATTHAIKSVQTVPSISSATSWQEEEAKSIEPSQGRINQEPPMMIRITTMVFAIDCERREMKFM